MKKIPLLMSNEQIQPEQIRSYRKSRKESQTEFWLRFGVTQSRGSRFELGMELPDSLVILVQLYLDGTVTDSDLQRARHVRKAIEKWSATGHRFQPKTLSA